MPTVTMGLAGQPNVTITMINNVDEETMLEQADPKDMSGARYGLARKRLMNDKYSVVKDGKEYKTPHCAEAILFPIST